MIITIYDNFTHVMFRSVTLPNHQAVRKNSFPQNSSHHNEAFIRWAQHTSQHSDIFRRTKIKDRSRLANINSLSRDYEESYGSYNHSGGESYQMRIKGSQEFIPYSLFEALKVRDLRLEPVPHYSDYGNIRNDSQ